MLLWIRYRLKTKFWILSVSFQMVNLAKGARAEWGRKVVLNWFRATSLWLFTFIYWRKKWQPTPVFLPGESQGRWSLMGCRLWGRTELDTKRLSSSSRERQERLDVLYKFCIFIMINCIYFQLRHSLWRELFYFVHRKMRHLLACSLYLEIFTPHLFHIKLPGIFDWHLTQQKINLKMNSYSVWYIKLIYFSWINFLIFDGLYITWAYANVLSFDCPLGSLKKKNKWKTLDTCTKMLEILI